MFDFLTDDVNIPVDEYVEPEKTTLMDNIAIVTYLKKLKPILDNDGFFFGVIDCVQGKDGKIYENLSDVKFVESECPKTALNEIGVGKKVVQKILDINYPQSIIRYLSFHPDSVLACHHANSVSDLTPEVVMMTLEQYLPKKKLYIKNHGIRVKKENEDNLIEEVQKFFKVSKIQAQEYVDRIDICGKLEEFSEHFLGGEVKEKKTKKKKEKEEVKKEPEKSKDYLDF
ncbi:MAG TPA: hypothetical protein PK151_05275 [Caldisericia bacterium]|nr:hypothetical protein [Caldisericia bacterium]